MEVDESAVIAHVQMLQHVLYACIFLEGGWYELI